MVSKIGRIIENYSLMVSNYDPSRKAHNVIIGFLSQFIEVTNYTACSCITILMIILGFSVLNFDCAI